MSAFAGSRGLIQKLPNQLTVARIVAIAPILGLLFVDQPWARQAALLLFLAAAATDWLDGWIARKFDAGSPFGRMLDPIADKLLVGGVLLVLIATGDIQGWTLLPALAIQLREILVSGLRESGVSLPVSRLAKWKTAVQLVVLALLICRAEPLASPGLWVAAALTVWTGWDYLRASIRMAAAGGN